jgi:GNAT superfamily N-acetyltransferase
MDGIDMFAAGYVPKHRFGWIEVVSAKQPGTGTGTAVVEWFEDWVRQQGGTEIRAEALENSLGFWTKMGFEPAGEPTPKWRYPIRKKL